MPTGRTCVGSRSASCARPRTEMTGARCAWRGRSRCFDSTRRRTPSTRGLDPWSGESRGGCSSRRRGGDRASCESPRTRPPGPGRRSGRDHGPGLGSQLLSVAARKRALRSDRDPPLRRHAAAGPRLGDPWLPALPRRVGGGPSARVRSSSVRRGGAAATRRGRRAPSAPDALPPAPAKSSSRRRPARASAGGRRAGSSGAGARGASHPASGARRSNAARNRT